MAKKKKGGEEDEEGGGGAKGMIIKIVVALVVGVFIAKTFFLKPPPPTEEALKAKAKGTFVDMAYKCAATNEVAYDQAAIDAEFEHHYAEEHATAPTTVAAAPVAPVVTVAPTAEAPAEESHTEAPAEASHKIAGFDGGGLGLKLAAARPGSGAGGAVATGPALLEVEATTINLTDGHFLKVGVTLELAHGSDPEAQKTHGTGSLALSELIEALSGKSMDELGSLEAREQIISQLGYSVCKKTSGGVVKAYFTDFVMQ